MTRKKLIKVIAISFVPIVIIYAIFFVFLNSIGKETYLAMIGYITETFGLGGIFLYSFLVDLLILPLSPDLVWFFAITFHPLVAILTIGIASSLGGVVSYLIGRSLSKIKLIDGIVEKTNAKWGDTVKKYGALAIVITGLLPLPFSTISLATGAAKIASKKIIPACFIRVVRSAIYYYLFILGFNLI